MIEVKTQAALDKALEANANAEIILMKGDFHLEISAGKPMLIVMAAATLTLIASGASSPSVVAWGTSSPRVVAWGTSSPRVVARETSSPSVVAWETSSPRVEAWETSSPRVEAWGTSSPSVVAWGFSSVYAKGAVKGTATEKVTIRTTGKVAITGGIQIDVSWSTPREWCDFYGVRVVDDIAYVYKGVNDQYRSPHGGAYTPGTTPRINNFHKGLIECGPGALYFSPHPRMTREFFSNASKFLLCPVRLDEIAVHPNGDYPQKIGAAGCCGPVVECDEDGEIIPITESVA